MTDRGWGLLLTGVVLGMLVRVTGAAELAVLAVPAVALPLLAWGWTHLPPSVAVRRTIEPETVVRGQRCACRITVQNVGRRTSGAHTVIDHFDGESRSAAVPRLRPGQQVQVSMTLDAKRRGLVPLGPLLVSRGDPFALAVKTVAVQEAGELPVRPRRYPLSEEPPGVRANLAGAAALVPHGSSVFNGLKDYAIGDDTRRIHWRSSARSQTLQVAVFLDASVPTLALLLDDRAGRYDDEERFEDAVEVAASLVDLAGQADLGVEVRTVSGRRAAALGDPAGLDEIEDLLTVVQLDDAGGRLVDLMPLDLFGATAVLVTGSIDDTDADAVARLRSSVGRLTVVSLADESAPPPVLNVPCLRAGSAPEAIAAWDAGETW